MLASSAATRSQVVLLDGRSAVHKVLGTRGTPRAGQVALLPTVAPAGRGGILRCEVPVARRPGGGPYEYQPTRSTMRSVEPLAL